MGIKIFFGTTFQFSLLLEAIPFQLLLTVIQKIAMTKKAFSVVAALVRIHLISLLDVFELLRSTRRNYLVRDHPPNRVVQLKFALT